MTQNSCYSTVYIQFLAKLINALNFSYSYKTIIIIIIIIIILIL